MQHKISFFFNIYYITSLFGFKNPPKYFVSNLLARESSWVNFFWYPAMMCVQLILLLLLRLGRSKYRSMINLIPSCQCCLHYTHIIFLFYRVRSNSWKPIEIFVSPTFLFFFSSKILKRHFTNIVQIIINHIPLWNSWREDYSDLNGFWIIKLNLVCFESYSSVDTTVNQWPRPGPSTDRKWVELNNQQ